MRALKRLGLHLLLWLIYINVVVLWTQLKWGDALATGLFMFPVLMMFMGYMGALAMESLMYGCCKEDKAHNE